MWRQLCVNPAVAATSPIFDWFGDLPQLLQDTAVLALPLPTEGQIFWCQPGVCGTAELWAGAGDGLTTAVWAVASLGHFVELNLALVFWTKVLLGDSAASVLHWSRERWKNREGTNNREIKKQLFHEDLNCVLLFPNHVLGFNAISVVWGNVNSFSFFAFRTKLVSQGDLEIPSLTHYCATWYDVYKGEHCNWA